MVILVIFYLFCSLCSLGRYQFWDEVFGLWEMCGNKWCMWGEFNFARFVNEKVQ